MKKEIEVWLTDWFIGRQKIGGQEKRTVSDVDYFEARWLTSMEVVEFVTEIEGEFSVQFSDRDLQDPRFVTIGGLAEVIRELSAQASESIR